MIFHMEMLVVVMSLVLCQLVSGLSDISVEEFARFPTLHHLDRLSPCIDAVDGVYCVANAELIADDPNELYDELAKYSLSAMRHLDYRKIRYGYCMTRRCKEFYTGDSDAELEASLGACLNHTLQQEYGLRARVEHAACYRYGDQRPLTWLDCAAAALYLSFVGLVVAGTLYDLLATKKDTKGYLMCFSIAANWTKLTAPWPKDQTTARLIGINGIRALNSILVLVVHTTIPLPAAVGNPYAMEEAMESTGFQFVVNAHIIVQTFFFLSGMFLAYTTQVSNERSPMTWRSLPKAILLRLLRLSPVYLFMLLYVVTWFRFVPYGPLWQELVGNEVHGCQRDWRSAVFFYNNYVVGSPCQPHHWSTAVDVHLHVTGLVVLLLPAGARAAALGLLLAVAAVAPAAETYYRDLDGVFISSGKNVQNTRMFEKYETFNYLYRPTHTNMFTFFMGMAFGLFLYKWMKKSVDTSQYKRYVWLYWLVLPLCAALIHCNSFLHLQEGARPAMRVRLMHALVPKLVWGAALAALIFGMICRVENVYRRVLEWRGWVTLTRLTYCLYNVHMYVIRWVYAADTQLTHFSDLHMAIKTTGIIVFSFALAVPMWLLVEAPSNNVVRKLFPEKKSILDVNTETKKTE